MSEPFWTLPVFATWTEAVLRMNEKFVTPRPGETRRQAVLRELTDNEICPTFAGAAPPSKKCP